MKFEVTDDRRKTPRITLRQLAHAAGHDPESGQHGEVIGATADVSEGGLRFQAQRGFKEGAEVSISFAVGDEIVEAIGRIAHFSPQKGGDVSVGIQFLHLSESDRRFIENYCRTKGNQ